MMRFLTLTLTCILLASCSKKREEATSLVREIPVRDAKQAMALVEEAHLRCEDAAQCPENVGLFIATNPGSLLTCTAFLVGEDLLATNSHCLPSVVKQLPDLCAERVQAIFPATAKRPEEKFSCKELLGASLRPNAISPDLALIRLEKSTGRQPLPLSLGGVEPEASFTAYKINPGAGASGTLVAQSCRSIPLSYRFPLYKQASDPVFLTGGCPSLPGNSGAPLVNSRGEAVGAFQAALGMNELQQKAWSPYLLPGETFAPLALGTSLGCLGGASWNWRPDCLPVDEENIPRARIEDFDSVLAREKEELLAAAAADLPNIFRWKRAGGVKRALEKEETLSPLCFHAPDTWIEEFALSGGGYEPTAALRAELPLLRSKIYFNRYMQTVPRSEIIGMKETAIAFQPAVLAREGHSLVSVNGEESLLPTCLDGP